MQNKKPRVALDIDGVLVDLTPAIAEWAEMALGKTIMKKDITEWDLVTKLLGLSHEETVRLFNNVWHSNALRSFIIHQETPEDIKRLMKVANVIAVSAATEKQAGGKVEYIQGLDIGLPVLFVPFGKSVKHLLPFDVFIDDRAELIEDVVKQGKIGFLYSQPWNQSCTTGIRVNNLSEVVKWIKSHD